MMNAISGVIEQTDERARWGVFSGVSLAFFFLNLATFTSLGVVLYTMMADLGWSATAAGLSFSVLGIACGLSSPFAAIAVKWIGARYTIVAGAALLAAGFALAATTQGVARFYVGMAALGVGYSLAGNVPGVFLLSAWFERGSSRVIGLYYMLGALGSAFGPPLVLRIVAGSGGWRGHWEAMAFASAALGVACLALVRDARQHAAAPGQSFVAPAWTPREAVMTWQFLFVSAAMAATMACVTTNNSAVIPHLVRLGATPAGAAIILSTIAITATLVKGVAGRACEIATPAQMLTLGLALQGLGNVLLARADAATLQYASAIAYGAGWGLTYVAGTVLLLDFFGRETGSAVLSAVWLLTTVAAAGPVAAGAIADATGSYKPIFDVFAVMMFALALPSLFVSAPRSRRLAAPAE